MSNDYGGSNHGKRPFKSKPKNRLSFVCRDCRKLRYVTSREMSRAAKPRCLNCGGPLVESDTTADKSCHSSVAKSIKIDNELAPDNNGNVCCKSCNVYYRRHYALAIHLQESAKCAEKYRRENWLFLKNGKLLYTGTLCFCRTGKILYEVQGLTVANQIETVDEFDTLYEASEFVFDHVISLTAARTIDRWVPPVYVEHKLSCPGCNAKFVDGVSCSAKFGLILHLTDPKRKECFDSVRDVSLLKDILDYQNPKRH